MTTQRHRCGPTPRILAAASFLFLHLALAATAFAVPVIPGAIGFGVETPAGRGGKVYRVTNLNETGGGSLGACVAATGPRVCIFEVSGTIRLSADLIVRNNNLTIAGQTAPSPGILLRGASLRILASDVLVQHLRVRPGDDPTGPGPENRDALRIEGSEERPVRNVVIDHCSFSWSIDEVASAWAHWDNISLLNNIFAEPLDDSFHPEAGIPGDGLGHGYGVLIGPSDGSFSMIGNLMAHQVERNPVSEAARFVLVNNVVYNRRAMDVQLLSFDARPTSSSIVGNVFIRGRDYGRDRLPVYVYTYGPSRVVRGSKVYLKDNVAQEATGDPWSLVGFETGALTRGDLEVTSPPVWLPGLVARPSGNALVAHVLAYAGARPTDRDSVDTRIVKSVRDRTGGIINCVSPDGSARCSRNGGGWPLLPMRRRPLLTPYDPKVVTPSGYTNLEIWLQSLGKGVEGAPPMNGPNAPTDVRVQ